MAGRLARWPSQRMTSTTHSSKHEGRSHTGRAAWTLARSKRSGCRTVHGFGGGLLRRYKLRGDRQHRMQLEAVPGAPTLVVNEVPKSDASERRLPADFCGHACGAGAGAGELGESCALSGEHRTNTDLLRMCVGIRDHSDVVTANN